MTARNESPRRFTRWAAYAAALALGAAIATAMTLPQGTSAQAPVCALGGPLDADLLGAAASYSEFIRTDSLRINESEGRVAVGGDFTVSSASTVGFRAGFGLPPGSGPTLVTGGDITSTGSFIQLQTDVPGTLSAGTYGGSYQPGGSDEGTITSAAPPFSFEETFGDLIPLSEFLAGCPSSPGATVGRYQGTPDTLLLTGTDPELNAFSLTLGQLQAARSVYLDVPIGSTTFVSSPDTAFTTEATPMADFWIRAPALPGSPFVQVQHCGLTTPPPGCFLNTSAGPIGPTPLPQDVVDVERRLLWNFPAATSFRKGAVGWAGTVLAPRAALVWGTTVADPTAGLGPFEGQVIVDSLTSGTSDGGLETHASENAPGDLLFVGRLPQPPPPEPPPEPPPPTTETTPPPVSPPSETGTTPTTPATPSPGATTTPEADAEPENDLTGPSDDSVAPGDSSGSEPKVEDASGDGRKTGGGLPFTGLAVSAMVLTGAGLAGAGVALRRRA